MVNKNILDSGIILEILAESPLILWEILMVRSLRAAQTSRISGLGDEF